MATYHPVQSIIMSVKWFLHQAGHGLHNEDTKISEIYNFQHLLPCLYSISNVNESNKVLYDLPAKAFCSKPGYFKNYKICTWDNELYKNEFHVRTLIHDYIRSKISVIPIHALHTIDRLLKDITGVNVPFDVKIFLLARVVAFIKSYLWCHMDHTPPLYKIAWRDLHCGVIL